MPVLQRCSYNRAEHYSQALWQHTLAGLEAQSGSTGMGTTGNGSAATDGYGIADAGGYILRLDLVCQCRAQVQGQLSRLGVGVSPDTCAKKQRTRYYTAGVLDHHGCSACLARILCSICCKACLCVPVHLLSQAHAVKAGPEVAWSAWETARAAES